MTTWLIATLVALAPVAIAEFHLMEQRVEQHDYKKHYED